MYEKYNFDFLETGLIYWNRDSKRTLENGAIFLAYQLHVQNFISESDFRFKKNYYKTNCWSKKLLHVDLDYIQ